MAFVTKQENGRWRARYRDPQGRARSRNFARKVDAEDFLTRVSHSKLVGAYVDPAGGRMLFDTWVERWEAGIVDLRPSTLARDIGYVNRYLIPTFGGVRLGEIDHAMVRGWVAELSTRKRSRSKNAPDDAPVTTLSPATVVCAVGLMKKIMAAAVTAGLLPSSPCVGIKVPRIEREEMRFLGPSEITALADAIDKRYRAVVLLGAYGGLRVGEMFGLRAKRVDILRARVDIAEILVEVSGHLHYGPPKTRAGRRTVPLPKVATEALDDHLRMHTAEPEDLVFRAPEGGPVRLAGWRTFDLTTYGTVPSACGSPPARHRRRSRHAPGTHR
jgi:integrase